MSWYLFFKSLCAVFGHAVARIEVEGQEWIPREGPFLLMPNHQSVLDPIFVQISVPRNDLFTLTKSTQFGSPFFRWVLPRVQAVPVRRFRVDPQAVRVVLRRLDAGAGVCIYGEGERTWDGAIQPLRRGTVRVLLRAGVPVIPCGVQGSFDVWPRWSRRLRRCHVGVRFGRPLEFGRHLDRERREELLEPTMATLREALADLSGAPLAPRRRAEEIQVAEEAGAARSGGPVGRHHGSSESRG